MDSMSSSTSANDESPQGGASFGEKASRFLQKNWQWLVPVAVVLLLLVSWYSLKQSIISDANKREASLNSQYEINKAQLGNCITKIRETGQVATGAARELDKVLTDIVSARYDQPNGPEVATGKAFSLLIEQYPDLSGLQANFSQVMIVITGCRNDFQGYQEKLRSEAAAFDAWATGSWVRRTFGGDLPNDKLKAVVLDNLGAEETLHGQAALDKMEHLITVHDANVAYQTGELTPESDPLGTNSSSGK